MKNSLLLLVLLSLGGIAMAQRQVNVIFTDGTSQQYVVQASGVVAFADENTIVVKESVASTPISISIDNIRKITFGTTPLGIVGSQPATALRLFPNPARDFTTIEGEGQREVVLYTMTGREVMRQTISGTAQIDLRNVAAGIYFFVAEGRVTKLVKMQ